MNQPIRTKATDQQGFSLVELMISMVLGLAVVAAVGTLSVNATRSYRSLNRTGEQIENGRYALNLIKSDLEHAGFFGIYNPKPDLASQEIVDPCNTSTELLAKSFLFPILSIAALPSTTSCTFASRKIGTSGVVIRRADSCGNITKCPVSSGDIYIYTMPDKYSFSAIETNDIRKYHTNIYYIRSYSQDPTDKIPTLMIKSPSLNDGNPDGQSVIEGIDNLQIQYGIDSDSNGSPDTYKPNISNTELPSANEWRNVIAVRLFLLARTLLKDPGYTDTGTYDLGNIRVTPGDQYHYRVFSSVVRLINISQRREK